jgi:hypothetical protein
MNPRFGNNTYYLPFQIWKENNQHIFDDRKGDGAKKGWLVEAHSSNN